MNGRVAITPPMRSAVGSGQPVGTAEPPTARTGRQVLQDSNDMVSQCDNTSIADGVNAGYARRAERVLTTAAGRNDKQAKNGSGMRLRSAQQAAQGGEGLPTEALEENAAHWSGLLRHRGLIRGLIVGVRPPVFRTPVARNPHVATAQAVVMQMPRAGHDEGRHAHVPGAETMWTDDSAGYGIFRVGHRRETIKR